MSRQLSDAQAVVDFWFGDMTEDGFSRPEISRRWFAGGPEFDGLCQQHWGQLVEQALASELQHWAQHAAGRLALILLLDQMPRNIFRGSARAFAGDAAALALAKELVARGLDKSYSFAARQFIYLPLEHSENPHDQKLSVQLFSILHDEVPAYKRADAADNLRWAQQHRELIQRFGRFPHRNQLLGRSSTAAELAYLAAGGHYFGQGS